ncbi:FecR family protein [Steroidobacter sp.]|uniref:FecR family protein n=1 Tax=Steroidobacter sp. TaxID=1978227 RepID=UPI001A46BDC8|nr:FecR domain-containing protein [Steroidobacter sp.]MBL8265436.1 FecR domain-containing protein [Steroidobacter sp.]
MGNSRQIEDTAAAWLARRDSGRWTDADQRELATWLNESVLNRVAFLRLEAGWEKSVRMKALAAGAANVAASDEWRSSPFFGRLPTSQAGARRWRRLPVGLAIAATALMALTTTLYLMLSPARDDYATPTGGLALVPLQDGSKLTLSTASRVQVSMTEHERRVDLKEGEAFFEVAHDTARPFVVRAGNQTITAVGTQFSVRREADDVRVVVTEGRVRIERDAVANSASLLAAGAVARTEGGVVRMEKRTTIEAEELLSWRSGYLTFDETTLADAVAEFNRYSSRKVIIDDASIAAVRISGKFRSNNASEFTLLLHTGFGIQVRESEDTVRLAAH